MSEAILEARGLVVRDADGRVLVGGADLSLEAGRCLGVVGESGSGKTLTMRACLGLLPPGLTWEARRLTLAGRELCDLSRAEHARLLGTTVGFVPQNTMEYLHPLIRVRDQIADGYLAWHPQASKAQALDRAAGLLARVGIAEPDRVLRSYPAQLSGGMRQRVNVAMALMGDPSLIAADEPTAALDCMVARQVVELLVEVARERGVAVAMVSHGLDMVRSCCDDLAVMYAGRVVERGAAREVFAEPAHPYTRALMDALPRVGQPRDRRLCELGGTMLEDGRASAACLFAPRCPLRAEVCAGDVPVCRRGTHEVACALAWSDHEGDEGGEGYGAARG